LPTKAKVAPSFSPFSSWSALSARCSPPTIPRTKTRPQPLPGRPVVRPSARHYQSRQDVFSQLLNGIRLTLELAFVVASCDSPFGDSRGGRRLPRGHLGRAAFPPVERLFGAPGVAVAGGCSSVTSKRRPMADDRRVERARLALGATRHPFPRLGHSATGISSPPLAKQARRGGGSYSSTSSHEVSLIAAALFNTSLRHRASVAWRHRGRRPPTVELGTML